MTHEQRRHFRIKYPISDRPVIQINGFNFPVADVSESGVKFVADTNDKPKEKQKLKGTILFGNRATHEFKAVVVRVVGDLIMLNFINYVPKEILIKEAERLVQSYGELKTDSFKP